MVHLTVRNKSYDSGDFLKFQLCNLYEKIIPLLILFFVARNKQDARNICEQNGNRDEPQDRSSTYSWKADLLLQQHT